MTNANAIAAILLKAVEEFKVCKRNKSGSVNQNAEYAIRRRAVAALMEQGETRSDAFDMVNKLSNKYAV